jgi:hypothetical protein
MKKPTTRRALRFPDSDEARTRRYLRVCRALFEIDDPEVEEAVARLCEHLARPRRTKKPKPAATAKSRKPAGPTQTR